MPDEKKSLTKKPSLDDNLIVHGDNLEALKSLLPHYAGKVKCVYIDPPYNTGNEGWKYNDNVNSPIQKKWLDKTVDRDMQDRHDRWLSMMMPRLKLLCELLHNDGVIFISIDDNEVAHLRMLMDEIFGEENYRNLLIIRRGVKSVQAQFETVDRLNYGAEYVLVYTKSSEHKFQNFYTELPEAKMGGWNNHWRGSDRPTMRYELFGITPPTGQWRWSKERSLEAIKNYKQLLKDLGKTGKTIAQEEIDTWWLDKFENGEEEVDLLRLSSNEKPEHYIAPTDEKMSSSLWSDLKPNGSQQLKAIFGKKVFDTPKSTDLLKRIIEFSGVEKDDIILDSFAGSGTTGHAVLALNKEDGGNRKFIMVEQMDYSNDVTAERIRHVIKGVKTAKDENLKKGLGGSFSYFTLGAEVGIETLLKGRTLPDYKTMAEFIFQTATGKPIETKKIREKDWFIGSNEEYDVYLLYAPDRDKLKSKDFAITHSWLDNLGKPKKGGRTRLVYAPNRFANLELLEEYNVEYSQLPYSIYRKVQP